MINITIIIMIIIINLKICIIDFTHIHRHSPLEMTILQAELVTSYGPWFVFHCSCKLHCLVIIGDTLMVALLIFPPTISSKQDCDENEMSGKKIVDSKFVQKA